MKPTIVVAFWQITYNTKILNYVLLDDSNLAELFGEGPIFFSLFLFLYILNNNPRYCSDIPYSSMEYSYFVKSFFNVFWAILHLN